MIFQILAAAVLLAFYAVYTGKMISQRRKGIRTDQIARGKKSGRRLRVELIMKTAAYSVVVFEAVSIAMDASALPLPVRAAGAAAGIAGDIVFALAVWTMRDSWRAGIPEDDRTEMVTAGIYRFSRNPAFLGFDLVYTGILLMFFNWVLLVFTVFAAVMLHLQIMQEEKFLSAAFGEEYLSYRKRVCRYIGRKRAKA